LNLQGFHHVALWVNDLAAARAFYVDALGFDVESEQTRPERGDTIWNLRLGEMRLELFCGAGHPPRASWPEALVLRHLAFRVQDIDAAVQTLAEHGFEAEPVRTDAYTGERMTFVRDPYGQPIELHM
jgi:glyoxylase I family protein